MTDRGHHGNIVAFSDEDNIQIKAPTTPSEELKFTIHPFYGGEVNLDFTQLKPKNLAISFANALKRRTQSGRSIRSGRTINSYRLSVIRFFEYLNAENIKLHQIQNINVACIDGFESWNTVNSNSYSIVFQRLVCILVLLREMANQNDNLFHEDVKDRLRYNSLRTRPKSKPRDAYSPFVARQLREAARKDIKLIFARLDKGPVITGEGLVAFNNAAAHAYIEEHGVISSTNKTYGRYIKPRYNPGKKLNNFANSLHAAHHLINSDLPPLLTLLALDTGLEPACLTSLSTDCLRNPSGQTIDICYVKRRAGSGPVDKTLRVRNDGPLTPGGLIRKIIQVTSAARQFSPNDCIWLYYGSNGQFKTKISFNPTGIWLNWCAQNNITDDDGSPLRVVLTRLRKTHKAMWYIKSQGQIASFAVGHTQQVAAKHYADIPALRDLHEQTISTTFDEVVKNSLEPTVLTPDAEAVLKSPPDPSKHLSMPVDSVKSLLNGEQDVWLASCGGFYSSPFSKVGQACSQPFWGCLECSNAVITARKLPAILAFLAFIKQQRHGLNADDWAIKFGRAHERITTQILPAFNANIIEDAKATLSQNPDQIHLPPEAKQ